MNEYLTEDYATLAEKLKEADAVLIGAGAGLSAATTLDYVDEDEFAHSYPNLAAKGIKTRWEALWTKMPSAEEHWALWATHVLKIRFDAPAGSAYLDLLDIIKNKEYFVITTNVDGQFIKAGFDSAKILATQGDYGYFQCALPCCDKLYPNEKLFRNMVANMDREAFKIRSQDIPRCPQCGGMIALNLRSGKNFVEDIWMEQSEAYADFFSKYAGKSKLLLLELGVGFNTPGIIRYPFEYYAKNYDGVFLTRFNKDHPEFSVGVPAKKSLAIDDNIKDALATIKKLAK